MSNHCDERRCARRMSWPRSVHIVAGCVVILVLAAAVFGADIWVGTWKLNVEASTSTGPLPKSQTTKIEAIEGGIKLTADGIDANGNATHTDYSALADGKDVPYKGAIQADTAALTRVDDYTIVIVYKLKGQVVLESRNTYSVDGRTRTLRQTGTDARGRAIDIRLVYDRQ